MSREHTLTRHRDIQNWVTDRHGIPAISRVRDRFGEERSQLKLRFHQHDTPHLSNLDEGVSPCSWSAWLAELDRQHLALKVGASPNDFELIERRDMN